MISVVVPVYKAEAFLNRCVDSILGQTMTNFELILVDDGSPDNSGIICDKYAREDKRVKVIHKPNGGANSARNEGLKEAKGTYLIFFDADDWVEKDILEKLYEEALFKDTDIVICDIYEKRRGIERHCNQSPSDMSSKALLEDILSFNVNAGMWNKLVRRSLFVDNNLYFDLSLKYRQDMDMSIRLLSLNPTIGYVPVPLYHYDCDINTNSITSKQFYENVKAKIVNTEHFYEITKGMGCHNICVTNLTYKMICDFFLNEEMNSEEFKVNLSDKAWILLKPQNNRLSMRILLYLSCKGFYKQAYSLYKITLKFRRHHIS